MAVFFMWYSVSAKASLASPCYSPHKTGFAGTPFIGRVTVGITVEGCSRRRLFNRRGESGVPSRRKSYK